MNTTQVTKVNLNAQRSSFDWKRYPRLMQNKRGEVILAVSKEKTLTTGILLKNTGKADEFQFQAGTFFTDWEVAGELEDFNKAVTVVFKNVVS